MINPESAAVCANCGAAMSGAYCSTCGQKTDVDPRSLRQWLHGILEDSLSIDGRLFQTLKALLTRPGFLTQEWRRGRQARWMHPFRLYLLASAIYFGVVALTPRDFVDVTVEDAAGLDIGMEAEIAAYGEAAAASAPRAMFLAVPLFALLLLLLFRGSGWLYTEHLVNAAPARLLLSLARGHLADGAPAEPVGLLAADAVHDPDARLLSASPSEHVWWKCRDAGPAGGPSGDRVYDLSGGPGADRRRAGRRCRGGPAEERGPVLERAGTRRRGDARPRSPWRRTRWCPTGERRTGS